MLHFLRKLLKVEPAWYPETKFLGPITDSEWAELLPELAKGYDNHKPFFRAMQVLLRHRERDMSRGPDHPITESSMLAWTEEQKRLVYQADLLRYLIRLPISATKEIKNKGKRAEMLKKEKQRTV